MILVITNEYNYKTHRQNIIDGLTRQQFVVAKILFGLAIAVPTTLSCFLIAIYFGSDNGHSISFKGISIYRLQFYSNIVLFIFSDDSSAVNAPQWFGTCRFFFIRISV